MSNRTLIEFNHDFTYEIEKNPEAFVEKLVAYLKRGPREKDPRNERIAKGLTFHGMRHHSDGFNINWGSYKSKEG